MTLRNNLSPLSIDVRMMNSSGIGTYIRNVVPRIIAEPDFEDAVLLGALSDIRKLREPHLTTAVEFNAPIHSVAEQLRFPRIDSELFWSPNYNIPLTYRGKLVVTIHDLFHLACNYGIGGGLKLLYAKFFFYQVKRRASAILCDSHFTADELKQFTDVDTRKVSVIHLGIDSSWFSIPATDSPRSKPYMIAVGNVKPHKNLKRLVEAFELISDKIPHDLIIVGQKAGFVTGDHEVLKMGTRLGDRLSFTGLVDDQELKQLIANADTLVFPSLYEGFGLPPLEAMAAGCPVIAANAASIPEVCGQAVLYCDPLSVEDIAHNILKMVTDNSLKLDFICRGREHAKLFRWENCAAETIDVFRSLM